MTVSGLRIVTFNVLPPAYQLVTRWTAQTQSKIALVVTTPGPSTRRTPSYRGVVESASLEHDVLVTTRLRRVAAPLIRELKPDLVLSFTFPYRIPPEITSIPRYGAVNLHPTPLPYYRGPNPLRLVYDGFPFIGATLHRTEEDFDTGVIYSQHTAPLPEPTTVESIWAVWPALMMQTLSEGIEAALSGAPGKAQDHTLATYGAQFSEAERWLDWSEPRAVVQRKTTALNVFGAGNARARIGGQTYAVEKIEPAAGAQPDAEPGTLLERGADHLTVRVADGAVHVFGAALPPTPAGVSQPAVA